MDPLRNPRERLLSGEAVIAGVLSGTSADGIDVALVRFPPFQGPDLGAPETLAFDTFPFEREVARRLRPLLDGSSERVWDLAWIATLSRDLGRSFGRAARELALRRRLTLDLVGSHGQTVFHHDGRPELAPSTLQLGDSAFIAEEAQAPVVHDFRSADLAAGGEGAPLSALCDEVLFPRIERPAVILNLGGMANVSYLPERGEILAFDTGPAGSLLDGLARRLLGTPFDEDGACASRGQADPGLVAELLSHPFFDRRPPKSTGRDTFGEGWVTGVVELARARGVLARGPEALLATAVEFVARSVADACERFLPTPPRSWALSGGGARNAALARALLRRIGSAPGTSEPRVGSSAMWGIDPDAREALVFAVLAARAVLGVPSTNGATGARAGHLLGSITPYRVAAG